MGFVFPPIIVIIVIVLSVAIIDIIIIIHIRNALTNISCSEMVLTQLKSSL